MSARHHKNNYDKAPPFTLTSRDAVCEKLGRRTTSDAQPSTLAVELRLPDGLRGPFGRIKRIKNRIGIHLIRT